MNKTVRLMPVQAASANVSAIDDPARRIAGLISADAERLGAVLVPPRRNGTGGSVRLTLPFGVVIGDSISEGVPHTYGRLKKDGAPGFNPSHRNMPGQLSYEFGERTGMHWFNHGIGSQRTDQVWARWRRDVLGETFDPGDGRGDRTLPGQAYAVFIIAGINDVFQGKDDAFIREHLLLLAKDARQRGIICMFSDMGEHNAATPEMREQIVRINRWMHDTLPSYGAHVFDFYEWSMDRSRGFGVHPAFFVDDVHPSRSGFQSLASHYASQWDGIPLAPVALILESVIDRDAPPAAFGRARRIEAGEVAYGDEAASDVREFELKDEPFVRLPIRLKGRGASIELAVAESFGNAELCGFSAVRLVMGDRWGP